MSERSHGATYAFYILMTFFLFTVNSYRISWYFLCKIISRLILTIQKHLYNYIIFSKSCRIISFNKMEPGPSSWYLSYYWKIGPLHIKKDAVVEKTFIGFIIILYSRHLYSHVKFTFLTTTCSSNGVYCVSYYSNM